jgi:two-component system chemotaxis response regulator CheB
MEKTAPYVVAIGASGAEGLDDIIALLCALSKPVPAIVMVVLHRPSEMISHLRAILDRACGMPVIIAAEAENLVQGTCYIGEPGGHLTLVTRHAAHLVAGANERLRNRSVDTLFISVAEYAGSRAVGIVLSGSLDDGSRGLAAIHAAGGLSMVLDPGFKPRGMQQNAIEFDGPIDLVGTAWEIADRIDHMLDPATCG